MVKDILRYADGTILNAKTYKSLHNLLDIVVKESEKKGLALNNEDSETVVMSRRKNPPKYSVTV